MGVRFPPGAQLKENSGILYPMRSRYTGFTLIELLVVIAIIGILASIILVSLNSARSKSRDAARMETVHQIQNALELYYSDYGAYPTVAVPSDLSSSLTPFLSPKYISSVTYDMTNISGPTYYSPANPPDSYLIYVSTERSWGVNIYGCRTGVGPDVDSGLYSGAPVCH